MKSITKKNLNQTYFKKRKCIFLVTNFSNKKLYKGDVCRICGGARNEHINEKDEYNKALALDKKKYEKDKENTKKELKEKGKKEKNKKDQKKKEKKKKILFLLMIKKKKKVKKMKMKIIINQEKKGN